MKEVVDRYMEPLNRDRNRHLVDLGTPLDTRWAKANQMEVGIGNFVADVVRDVTGADIGYINAGSLRGDTTFSNKLTYG